MKTLALLAVLALPLGAQPAPFHSYRTLDTPHFHVTVPVGLEREGRVAGMVAEHAYALLSQELKPPRGPIDLVVTDDADYSNGYATPVPTNRIVVFAAPPVESNNLRLNEDWLKLVITHELTHIFHLDRAEGVWGIAQHIFGRGAALFPNAYGPSWLTEGLAVYYESRFTEGGRLDDAEHRLLARAAAAENRLPHLDELSLASPLFPGGERAYGFGSLFIEYLAATRGDSTIGKFVDVQSHALIPFTLNRDARRAFGIDLGAAFARWRDSVQRTTPAYAPPLAGWRELTAHPYYATDPRWLNDTLLVYSANDGRSTAAEYMLRLDGTRTRTGRRNSLGASVPMPGGGLLFTQQEFETSDIVRSDLYIEKDGVQRRLTHGQRLVEPDVRSDGTILAVQLGPTRASLVLVDSSGRVVRPLRRAAADETWSDARWSPDGSRIVVVHRPHGGAFEVVVIDVNSNAERILDRGHYIIATPVFSRDGASVLYTSEASGRPALSRRSLAAVTESANAAENVYSPEFSPNGALLAASELRADGYHVGVAPAQSIRGSAATSTIRVPEPAAVDSQPLAPGDYHAYSPWRSLVPQYWYPLIEAAPEGGTRLGATTSGHDIVYRHIYDGFAALTTSGRFATGRLTYQYAGFRRPYVNFQFAQDYSLVANLTNGGTATKVGSLLQREQNTSLSITFVRPRVRTFSSLSVGGNIERRSFNSDPDALLIQLDSAYAKSYVFPSVFASVGWANTQRPSLSISPEDGISVSLIARDRWRTDISSATRSASLVGVGAAYKSLDLPGFAHHVLALRAAGGVADRQSASEFDVGGISGTSVQVVPGYTVGDSRRTFGVRGFPVGAVYGTSAGAGSLEYRVPLLLPAKGLGDLPFFFDRTSVSFFADAGIAGCAANVTYSFVCAPAARLNHAIASVGAEALLSAAILDYDSPQNIRAGVAVPVAGRSLVRVSTVSAYLTYGLSF